MQQTNKLPIVGKRVKIALQGHNFDGQKATITKISKKNYSVKIDGVKTPLVVAHNQVKGFQGRRPKSN